MPTIASLLHGFFSGHWRKQALLFGFSGVWQETYQNTALAAGALSILFHTVPQNRVEVVTFSALRYDGTVPARLYVGVNRGGYVYPFHSVDIPVSGDFFTVMVNVPIIYPETLYLVIENATLNNDVWCFVSGYYFNTED